MENLLAEQYKRYKESPTNKIDYLFVPREIIADFKRRNIVLESLLDYQTVKTLLPKTSIDRLMGLNGFYRVALEPLDNTSAASKLLTPLLSEATDLRSLWAARDDSALTLEELTSEEEGQHEVYRQYALAALAAGIVDKGLDTGILDMYDWTDAVNAGTCILVSVPFLHGNLDALQHDKTDVFQSFIDETLRAMIRKTSVYQREDVLVRLGVYSHYLQTLL